MSTTTTTIINQADNGSDDDDSSLGNYFDLELKVDKCKFYPLKPLAVIAGNVVAVTAPDTTTAINLESFHQQQLKIGDRCIVYIAQSSGQVPSLMKRWANECREDKKCTNWITIAEHAVTCSIDTTTILEKSRSVSGSYIYRSSRGIVRICDPPTLYVTMLMDQSKFYPSKLALLDGVILDINEDVTQSSSSTAAASTTEIRNAENLSPCLLAKGERCWLHVRSNVVTLLKTLHGGTMESVIDNDNTNENSNGNTINVINDSNKNKIATGWVQFTRSIPVTCRVVVDDNLMKRKCNMKGCFLLECYEIIDIQKNNVNSVSTKNNNHLEVGAIDTPHNHVFSRSSKRLDRKERHRVFAEWLVKIYTKEFLSTGSGVLDVAGGGGLLSHALWKLGVKSCLVDPEPRCDIEKVPFQVINESLRGDGSELTGNDDKDDDDENDLSGSITVKKRIRNLVRSASILVGMHPDEATEAVIDTSLRLGKPFAILPCCVFRNLNSERLEIIRRKKRDGGGDPFRSYNTFCQYLLDDKPPTGIQFETENLPFEGRNKVIYLQCFRYICQVINL
mmetsp:Transcript_13255/g.15064  ORF Transcript_13255/g.15064 Transcript_13255/m.15064 type:complete len:563 (+) Transcript_13255:62-1750(+)